MSVNWNRISLPLPHPLLPSPCYLFSCYFSCCDCVYVFLPSFPFSLSLFPSPPPQLPPFLSPSPHYLFPCYISCCDCVYVFFPFMEHLARTYCFHCFSLSHHITLHTSSNLNNESYYLFTIESYYLTHMNQRITSHY